MATIDPLLVILFMANLLILVLVILFVVKSGCFSLQNKIQFWLIAGYILLLLASPVVIQMLPKENFADERIKKVSEKDLYVQADLYTIAQGASPEQIKGVFVLEQWEFPYNGSMLNVVVRPLYEYDAVIVVERKDSADGKIEAVNYASKPIVELLDLSEIMKPHKVALDGNVLKVTAPEFLQIELGVFRNEFVISQILGDTELESAPWRHGSQLIYLRVPADVEVQSEASVHFVEKQ